MKVCVLQPDYSTTSVDYKNYDPPRDLTMLLPGDEVDHVFLNKLTTYKQLKELARMNYDVFVNLCEGYLEWSVPSIDVPYYLDLLQLPYTGPDTRVYDPSKELMKYVAFTVGADTPAFTVIYPKSDIEQSIKHLRFPLFIKPAKAGDSLGIDENSLVVNLTSLQNKALQLFKEYDDLLVEEYISGREFTVLVVANAGTKDCSVYRPLEYIFEGKDHFKTYALKTRGVASRCNKPCTDPVLEAEIKKFPLPFLMRLKELVMHALILEWMRTSNYFSLKLTLPVLFFILMGMKVQQTIS